MAIPSANAATDIMKTAFAFLPKDSVIRDAPEIERQYQRNVTALSRAISMVLCPKNADEIAPIIAEANQRSIPLYPISTGKNWGMGSKLPVMDGDVVLDLSRLNRI